MAIFNSVFESVSADDILDKEIAEAGIDTPESTGEPSEADEIVAEFCKEAYMLEASMYVADIQLESAVLEGASVDAVMENFLTNAIENAKKNILKLWEKLKKFFKETANKFKAFAAASASFVKKHGTEIVNKYKKFPKWTYSGYKFNEKAFEGAAKVVTDIQAKAHKSASDALDIDIAMANVGKSFKTYDTKAIPRSTYEDIETGSVAALGAVIMGACRGEEVENEHPDEGVVQDWVNTCRDAEKTLNKIYEEETKAKKAIADIITEFKKAENDAKDAEKKSSNGDSSKSTAIHNTIKFNSKLAAVISKVSTVIVNARTEQYRAYSRHLKDIYSLKGSGESVQEELSVEKNSYNLLNSAFGLF